VENGVAALRQEAFHADNHFSNASNKMFEAIIPCFKKKSYDFLKSAFCLLRSRWEPQPL
jgi:hypothetical protein